MIKLHKVKLSKTCPKELVALLKATGGSREKAARYAGTSASYLSSLVGGHSKYRPSPELIERFKAGLAAARAGKPLPPRKPVKPNGHRQPKLDPGEAKTPFAICFTNNKMVERLMGVGTALGGSWVYRRRLKSGDWIAIVEIDDKGRLLAFRTAADLAGEVVTP